MKKFIILIILTLAIGTIAQVPSKKDCYKKYTVSDTVYKTFMWRDTLNYVRLTYGSIITSGVKLTCMPETFYDTIMSQKYYVFDKQWIGIDPKLLIQIFDAK